MKPSKLLLLFVILLASCASPATLTSTQTSAPPTSTVEVVGTPTINVTPDPTMGHIEGDFSWFFSSTSTSAPIGLVNLEINGHTGDYRRFITKVGSNGHFTFGNIEAGDYGFGIYFNLPVSERMCETPEYVYGTDLDWEHYATWLKVGVWYDILFSSIDVTVKPGETVVLDFVLKCP